MYYRPSSALRRGCFQTPGTATGTARRCVARANATGTAKNAVESGTDAFAKGKYQEALRLYQSAMEMNPDEDEARAAMYNQACAHVKLKQWQQAAEAVKVAVNDYKLKVEVAQKDPDLKQLRERREWLDAQDEMAGVVARSTRLTLRSEAKAPFRLARTAIAGGLALGAGVGLLIISTRLVAAFAGAEGAPDLAETAKNFAINLAAFVALAYVVSRDRQSINRDVAVIDREEQLGRLQIKMGEGARIVPIAKLRGTVRPLVLAGSRSYINKCKAAVKRFKPDLVARGVSIVPVVLSEVDPEAKLRALKEEMAQESGKSKGFGPGKAEASKASDADLEGDGGQDKRWELKAHNVAEWADWIAQLKKDKGLAADNCFLQIQLDGSVRSSGIGVPSFTDMVNDLPPLDDVRTRFMDGVGPQVD